MGGKKKVIRKDPEGAPNMAEELKVKEYKTALGARW